MEVTNKDLKFLKETLRLAKKGLGWTNPNPMVGAVIVKNGKIIAKGYHKKYGGAHAEVEALKNAKESVQGATMYVSLEPHGFQSINTPPCTTAIIKAKIKKVVCCTLDPNKKVAGKGLEILKAVGVEVKCGFLEEEAKKLNEAFFTFHQKNRPFVVLKFASSLDGKIATASGDSKWITNDEARQYARQLRGQYQSIMVGANTVIKDNPNLGAGKNQKEPLRIILDAKLNIPLNGQIFRDDNVLVLTTNKCDKIKKEKFVKKGIEVVQLSGTKISAKQILQILKEKKIVSLFVEGGSGALTTFVDERLVDKMFVFHAPIIVGGVNSISAIGGKGVKTIKEAMQLKNVSFRTFGDNFLVSGDVQK